jgi:hypothetical protein
MKYWGCLCSLLMRPGRKKKEVRREARVLQDVIVQITQNIDLQLEWT